MRTGHNDTEDPAGRQGGDSQTGVTGLYQHAVPPCPNYNPHAELLEGMPSCPPQMPALCLSHSHVRDMINRINHTTTLMNDISTAIIDANSTGSAAAADDSACGAGGPAIGGDRGLDDEQVVQPLAATGGPAIGGTTQRVADDSASSVGSLEELYEMGWGAVRDPVWSKYVDPLTDLVYWYEHLTEECFYERGDSAWELWEATETKRLFWYHDDRKWFYLDTGRKGSGEDQFEETQAPQPGMPPPKDSTTATGSNARQRTERCTSTASQQETDCAQEGRAPLRHITIGKDMHGHLEMKLKKTCFDIWRFSFWHYQPHHGPRYTSTRRKWSGQSIRW